MNAEMKFQESINYLFGLGNETLTMKLGLETIRLLASACEEPQKTITAIHIAGTNGKGSTSAMTESILLHAGFKVGLYTSPHLVSPTERIRIGGRNVSEEDFARAAGLVRETSERLVGEGILEAVPTFFEQMTMIAFIIFARKKVELAVLEVGMGGRLDATNICEPLVTAVTPVSYDHQKQLGNSLGEIAVEKAGIIKSRIPVIVAPQDAEAMAAITSRAFAMTAPLIEVDQFESVALSGGNHRFEYRGEAVTLNLLGKHQVANASTAIKIVEQLIERGWNVSTQAIVDGLSDVNWPGRLQLIETAGAPILLDGAHNPAGAEALKQFVRENYASRPITLVFGAMRDKSISKMTKLLAPMAEKIVFTRVNNPRAATPVQLAGTISDRSICSDNVEEALNEALRITPGDGLIVVCGSLYLVGEVIRLQITEQME